MSAKKEAERENVDYSKSEPPAWYTCSQCGLKGYKMWRDYGDTVLFCADCAAKDAGKNIDDIDADGKRGIEFGQRTDQIGWYLPAVPFDDSSKTIGAIPLFLMPAVNGGVNYQHDLRLYLISKAARLSGLFSFLYSNKNIFGIFEISGGIGYGAGRL